MTNFWLEKDAKEEETVVAFYYWMCLKKFNFDKSIANHMQRKLLAYKPLSEQK